jgi:hypothetical protein
MESVFRETTSGTVIIANLRITEKKARILALDLELESLNGIN